MANGLISYGTYVPYFRLERGAIMAVLGTGGGRGARSVAAHDEDSTSMGVEAARRALDGVDGSARGARVLFATASPAYLDKSNATVVHAALSMDRTSLAMDVLGSVRSGMGAVLTAAEAADPTMVVLSDVRTGLPGGAQEANGGDGSAALLFGRDTSNSPVIAELIAEASVTAEFLDHWRLPDARTGRSWEERFGEQAYLPLASEAFAEALKRADLAPDDVDHLIVAGLNERANRSFLASTGVDSSRIATTVASAIGNCGTALAALELGAVLDRAEPSEVVAMVVLADGAIATLWRTTSALPDRRARRSIESQLAAGNSTLPYARYLTWRGELQLERPRRPDPRGPASPPSFRSEAYKYGFVGSRCDECGQINVPPVRVCTGCRAMDRMTAAPIAELGGSIATYAIDHLAWSKNPPVVVAVVDIDGGGRFSCELADVDPDEVQIGDRVEMTFRRLTTAEGIHNYFWKAKRVSAVGAGSTKR